MRLEDRLEALNIVLKILKKLFEGSNGPELDLTSRGHWMIWDCGRGLGMYHDGGLYPRVPKKRQNQNFRPGEVLRRQVI